MEISALSPLVWLSELPDISISSPDADSVDVVLLCGGKRLLATTLFTSGGVATFYDIAPLVSLAMRTERLVTAVVTVTAKAGGDTASTSAQVVYADDIVGEPVRQFTQNKFLTTLSAKRVSGAGMEHVAALLAKGEQYSFTSLVVYEYAGEIATAEIPLLDKGAVAAFTVAEMETSLELMQRYLEDNQVPFSRIIAYTVNCGARSISYYISNSAPSARLMFRNTFGCWEQFSLPAATTRSTEVKRSVANLGRASSFYNQSVTRSYEVVTAPLNSDEHLWCEQLAASRDVRFFDDTTVLPLYMPQVLVTESTPEFSDDDSESSVFKFTWRFADAAPRISGQKVVQLTGVFTEQFTFQYS